MLLLTVTRPHKRWSFRKVETVGTLAKAQDAAETKVDRRSSLETDQRL